MIFRRGGFSPPLSLLMSAFALLIRPPSLTTQLQPLTERSSTVQRTDYRRLMTDEYLPVLFKPESFILFSVLCNLSSEPTASVISLAPVNLPRRPTRLVSYYAFFKGWLLLSQPPSCLSLPTSFPTELILGTLAGGLGCFPFDDGR